MDKEELEKIALEIKNFVDISNERDKLDLSVDFIVNLLRKVYRKGFQDGFFCGRDEVEF